MTKFYDLMDLSWRKGPLAIKTADVWKGSIPVLTFVSFLNTWNILMLVT